MSKFKFIIIVAIFANFAMFADTTFNVSDVELAKEPLPEVTNKEIINRYFQNVEAYSKSDKMFVLTEKEKKKKANYLDGMIIEKSHPFVQTLHLAFMDHRPISISPDMIWLMICQGFAQHVDKNAEKLRDKFVKYQNRKMLRVRRDEFLKGSNNNNWQGVFEELSQKIEEQTHANVKELIVAKFSTTTPIEKAAFEITLMDSMSSFFFFYGNTECGIPSITLEGTLEDWGFIIEKAKKLKEYDLDWWINPLLPILQEFANAANGKVNKKHWKSIYKYNNQSGGPFVTGWILNFFPYVKDKKNSYLKRATKLKWGGFLENSFPIGISEVSFDWNYLRDLIPLNFCAGFLGVSQDKKSKTLRPEIGWIINKRIIKDKTEILYEKGCLLLARGCIYDFTDYKSDKILYFGDAAKKGFIPALTKCGQILIELEKYQRGINYLKEAMQQNDIEAIRTLLLIFQKGLIINPNKIRESLQKRNLSLDDSILLQAQFFAKFAKENNKLLEEIEHKLNNIKEENSKSAEYFNTLGLLNYIKKDYERARVNFEKAIELDKTKAVYYYDVATTYLKLNNQNDALENMTKATEIFNRETANLKYLERYLINQYKSAYLAEYFSNAIINNNIELVKLFLDADWIIDNPRDDLYCIQAFYYNHKKMYEFLVDKTDHYSLMEEAIIDKNTIMIDYLLNEKQFDINTKNKDGESLLFSHIVLDSIKLLLSKGMNIHEKDKNDATVLFYAVLKENVELVKFLISKGADINAKTDDGRTILMHSALSYNTSILKYIFKQGFNVNEKDNKGRTALSFVEYSYESGKFLIDNGATISPKNDYKFLFKATHDYDIVKQFIDAGVDVNISYQGKTLLFEAVKNEDIKIVELLINTGADINVKDKSGNTAILHAALNKHNSIVQLLLKHNANTNWNEARIVKKIVAEGSLKDISLFAKILNKTITDYPPESILYAGYNKDINVLKKFVNNDFDMNYVNDDNKNIIDAIINTKDIDYISKTQNNLIPKILFLLKEKVNIKYSKILISCFAICGTLEDLRFILDKFDKNIKDLHPNILFPVSRNNNAKILKYLIKNGFDITIKDKWDNSTLLQSLIEINDDDNIDTFKLLLKHQKDINEANQEGKTLLSQIVINTKLEYLQEIIKYNPNPFIKDIDGKTPLDYAKDDENNEMIKILEEYIKTYNKNLRESQKVEIK